MQANSTNTAKLSRADKRALAQAAKAAAKAAPEAAPAPVVTPETAAPASDLTRDARIAAKSAQTVSAQRTNYGSETPRDLAYLRGIGDAARDNGDTATMLQIRLAGVLSNGVRVNRYYNGSAKADDAGAIVRLIKAGYFTASADGDKLAATDKAKAHAHYRGAPKA